MSNMDGSNVGGVERMASVQVAIDVPAVGDLRSV